MAGSYKIQTPHKEFWGPRPCISFRIPTERSEAKRCDGCDDSGTTCEADLGRRKGARGRGTGKGGCVEAVKAVEPRFCLAGVAL